MRTPKADESRNAFPDKDFVCVGFSLPVDTAPFEAAFGDGGSRIKYLPPGWSFQLIERSETFAHALFKVELTDLKGLQGNYAQVQTLIKRAYKR